MKKSLKFTAILAIASIIFVGCKKTTDATPSNVPSITVLSPNGGEVYQVGQKITVKWSTQNIKGNISEISLIDVNGWGGGIGLTFDKDIPNTGSYIVTLPDSSDFSSVGASYGKYFKIEIISGDVSVKDNATIDVSDNLFTLKK